ncbi:MAG TPA: glycosyltransferase [Verrucomicrobia bacterium]|nr:glycosyltransferase [Verrucomicrobiota bacterium]HOP99114.1 glycosyltransferase [Verrucomicrobiota bacterium]HPU56715.1 glycosyltransferase [Verrucomicrobiota bacterium]
MDAPHYVIISPVRNEERVLPSTIRSVAGQSILPAAWIIVNDGSTDGTGRIADEAAKQYSWIRSVHRHDRGFRKSGSGVVEAFYDGYRALDRNDWEYLAKLDGDLDFGPDFVQNIFKAFDRDPKLGICGGDIYHNEASMTVVESRNDPAFHVRGATKFYRRSCWDAIGGLVQATGWDTLDEVKANMLGWTTYRVAEARALHLRPTGAADGGWRNAFKNGRGSYISGYHPLYMLCKVIRRLPHRPVVVQSAGLLAGFFTSYFAGVQRISDEQLIRFLRRQQLRRIFGLRSIWR